MLFIIVGTQRAEGYKTEKNEIDQGNDCPYDGSPLSVDDFVKKTQYTYYTRDALKQVAYDVHLFATKEGLTAHAKSAIIRIEDDNE